MKLSYQLSREVAKAEFVSTGNGAIERVFDVAAEALTPEQRAMLVEAGACGAYGDVRVETAKLPAYPVGVGEWRGYPDWKAHLSDGTADLGRVLDDAGDWFAELARILEARRALEPARLAKARAARAAKAEALRGAIEARNPAVDTTGWKDGDLDGLVGRYRTMHPQFEQERAEREAAEKAERETRRKAEHETRLTWAREHGSDRLRRGLEAGHECGRLYWRERAGVEYSGFVADIEKTVDWKDRPCPSTEALDLRDATLAAHPGVKATVVWLTEAPADRKAGEYEEIEDFDPCEGLVVDDDDYPYLLVRAV